MNVPSFFAQHIVLHSSTSEGMLQTHKAGQGSIMLCLNAVSFLQETQQIPTEDVALDICLSNGQKVTVNILTSDQTEDVLDVSFRARKHTAHGGAVWR